jgi:hypothetical protein
MATLFPPKPLPVLAQSRAEPTAPDASPGLIRRNRPTRRTPGSRKHPHFNRDHLAAALPKSGVDYHWLEALGGRRHQQRDESPNLGLENRGFRNFADHMLTDEFREGVARPLEVGRRKRTAILCAEGLFWQCHRRLVAEFLAANGVAVQHIMPGGELLPHTLTPGRSRVPHSTDVPRRGSVDRGRAVAGDRAGMVTFPRVKCFRPARRWKWQRVRTVSGSIPSGAEPRAPADRPRKWRFLGLQRSLPREPAAERDVRLLLRSVLPAMKSARRLA